MAPSRRDALQVLGATVLSLLTAGCSTLQGTSRGVTDVIIQNRTDVTATVSITVTYADGATAIDETLTIAPDEHAKINNEVVMETDTTVKVQVKDGPTGTYDWSAAFEALYVTITEGGIAFEEKP